MPLHTFCVMATTFKLNYRKKLNMKNFNQFTPADHQLLADFSTQDTLIIKHLTNCTKNYKKAIKKSKFYRANLSNQSAIDFAEEIGMYYGRLPLSIFIFNWKMGYKQKMTIQELLEAYLEPLNPLEVSARIQCFGINDLLAMQSKPRLSSHLYLMNVAKFVQGTINDNDSSIKEIEFSKHLASLILDWINPTNYQFVTL